MSNYILYNNKNDNEKMLSKILSNIIECDNPFNYEDLVIENFIQDNNITKDNFNNSTELKKKYKDLLSLLYKFIKYNINFYKHDKIRFLRSAIIMDLLNLN